MTSRTVPGTTPRSADALLPVAYRYLNVLADAPARRYGFTYLAWLRNGCVGHEPERGGRLTRAKAFEVRSRLHELLDNRPLDIAASR